jgi:Protein of unknown function (DUF4238)
MTTVLEAANHHLVSRGYQNNFADDTKHVAVLDARSGQFLELRPTKRNWARSGFNSFVMPGGEVVSDLEGEWARLERRVLNQIREIAPGRCTPKQAAGVKQFFAIHLVRSATYAETHTRIMEEVRRDVGGSLEGDPEAAARFEADLGRPPRPGELQGLAERLSHEHEASGFTFVESMATVHNKLAAMFTKWRVQIVAADPAGPGFVISDLPVVHFSSARQAYGFRDRLALGDADLVGAPLTRYTAAFLSQGHTPDVLLKTKKQLQRINALFWRCATSEVACHPDDVREATRVWSHLSELPPEKLRSG